MSITNTILIVAGALVILIGLAAFFNPSFTRLINVPGGPKLKAIGSIIIGVVLLIIGLIIKFPAK